MFIEKGSRTKRETFHLDVIKLDYNRIVKPWTLYIPT